MYPELEIFLMFAPKIGKNEIRYASFFHCYFAISVFYTEDETV